MDKIRKDSTKRIFLWIVFCFAASRALMFAIYILQTHSFSLFAFIGNMNTWDAGWYDAYVRQLSDGTFPQPPHTNGEAVWAFFPLYPLLVAGFGRLLGGAVPIWLLGSALSSAFFMLSEYVASLHIRLTRGDEKTAYVYIAAMSFGLHSFYFSILYTEALFLLLLTCCFYFLEKEQYLRMGVCGALLSATRNVGVMFCFVVLADCIMKYRRREKRSFRDFLVTTLGNEKLLLGTCLIPAGLFSYIAFLKYKLGDGLAFLHVQRAWGRNYTGIWGMLRQMIRNFFPHNYLGVFLLLAIALLFVCAVEDKRFHEILFPSIVIVLAITSTLQSIPRFMIGSYTVVLGFCDQFRKMRTPVKIAVAVLLVLFELGLMREWILANPLLC